MFTKSLTSIFNSLYFVYMINMYFTNTVFEELDTSLMTECP